MGYSNLIMKSEVQDTLRGFVSREVCTCQTHIVEYVLKKSWEDSEAPFSWDDVENYYVDNSEEIEELKDKLFEDILTDEEIDEIEEQIEELENEQDNPQEVYEWWEVTSWFAEKLKAHNEVVISDYGYGGYWGRCTTGQAIWLDGIIMEIADELGMLDKYKDEKEVA